MPATYREFSNIPEIELGYRLGSTPASNIGLRRIRCREFRQHRNTQRPCRDALDHQPENIGQRYSGEVQCGERYVGQKGQE